MKIIGEVRNGQNVKNDGGLSYKNALDFQDQFMSILITELRYQDPMEPMKEKDFFAQMAQFTTAVSVTSLEDTVKESVVLFQEGQNRIEEALLLMGMQIGKTLSKDNEHSLVSLSKLLGTPVTCQTDEGLYSGRLGCVYKENGDLWIVCRDKTLPAKSIVSFGGNLSAD